MELAILFWFYKEPNVCENRLQLLRRYNPTLKIFGLFGGQASEISTYQSQLGTYLDDFYASPFGDHKTQYNLPWKWVNGDLMLLDWYNARGKKLIWDSSVVIQWDNIVFDSLLDQFPGIKKDEIYFFGLTEIDSFMEKSWGWISGARLPEYSEFLKYVKEQYGYHDKPLVCFFALEVFPKIFFEHYLMVDNRELGAIEYRVPTYAKIFGVPFYERDLGQDIGIGMNMNGPIRYQQAVNESFIKDELLKKNGWRIFHPYSKLWCPSP